METLARYFGSKFVVSRRSFLPLQVEESISSTVKLSLLCSNLIFCEGDIKKFAEDYVIVQAKGVENILQSLLGDDFKSHVYENQLKHYLKDVRDIFRNANTQLVEDGEESLPHIWIDVIKKISAKFQELASIFVTESHTDGKLLKRNTNHKLILATIIIEMKYLVRVCLEHGICVKTVECTSALNSILEQLEMMTEDKVRLFIKYFYDELYDTPFYTSLSETTAHQFQVILNDMAYSRDVSAKNILQTIQKVVAARIDFINNNKDEKLSHDALLVHIILSDMDHVYDRTNPKKFHEFLTNFFEWQHRNVSLSKDMKGVLKEIHNGMQRIDEDLSVKLINEIRVFLEKTVEVEG